MKRAIAVALGTGLVITSAAAIGIGAAVSTAPHTLTGPEYQAALRGAALSREAALQGCEARVPAERETCRAQAAADEMLRVADIEEGYRHTREASRAAQRMRIEARYQVERTLCLELSGLRRDKCLVSAHAAKGRALLEAAAPYEVAMRSAQ